MTRAVGGGACLAVTQGDPSGIGVEIALRAWARRQAATPPFFLLADPAHVRRVVTTMGINAPVEAVGPREAASAFAESVPVAPLSRSVRGEPGRPTSEDAPATIEAIERAVALVRAGEASAIVTNPISKAVLYQSGFKHPGHTEFLGELSQRHFGVSPLPVMMLWSPSLAVVPITIHIALKEVFDRLTSTLIVATARVAAHDLEERFGVSRPRLAISGLNPHAGEEGAMGREEIELIAPAVQALRAQGLDASGPWPADTMFNDRARERYDVALCMYHDQALIPIKTLAFESAVNVTLGLPFVRTSPDHGTAYDIAGRGLADCASFEAALALAGRLANAGR